MKDFSSGPPFSTKPHPCYTCSSGLIVDVQVCIGELFYSRKRLLDCFIGLEPHCYRLNVLSVCTNRRGLMIRELIEKISAFAHESGSSRSTTLKAVCRAQNARIRGGEN
jgi:hypothetical protein